MQSYHEWIIYYWMSHGDVWMSNEGLMSVQCRSCGHCLLIIHETSRESNTFIFDFRWWLKWERRIHSQENLALVIYLALS